MLPPKLFQKKVAPKLFRKKPPLLKSAPQQINIGCSLTIRKISSFFSLSV